jgi:hypothetical protein
VNSTSPGGVTDNHATEAGMKPDTARIRRVGFREQVAMGSTSKRTLNRRYLEQADAN